ARSVACGGPHHTDGPPHVIRLLFSASPAPAPTALPPPSLHDALPIWGGCSYRGGGGVRFFVGAPPRCEPGRQPFAPGAGAPTGADRKSTRLNSSHVKISYAVCCLKKKTKHAGSVRVAGPRTVRNSVCL